MTKTFSYALGHVQPDVVLFLGDLIDEGSKASDMEFQTYIERFRTVFNVPGHIKVGTQQHYGFITYSVIAT